MPLRGRSVGIGASVGYDTHGAQEDIFQTRALLSELGYGDSSLLGQLKDAIRVGGGIGPLDAQAALRPLAGLQAGRLQVVDKVGRLAFDFHQQEGALGCGQLAYLALLDNTSIIEDNHMVARAFHILEEM